MYLYGLDQELERVRSSDVLVYVQGKIITKAECVRVLRTRN